MSKNNPQFEKHHRIAVIGAGPAGVHIASLLKRRGYNDVTVLEKSSRIGGKSYTCIKDGVLYEMGTCFLHHGYHRIKDLVRTYGLREGVALQGRAVFQDENTDNLASLELSEFVASSIYDGWQQQ